MSDMRHTAQALAAKGRFGDSMLLHVSPSELEGIASLIPGGLTTNPHTGLPEAFFFLPFLASLFGAAAPAAAAATTAAAAAAPALAGAAGIAATGAGAAGTLGTLGALGAPSAAMTAGTLASAAPAAAAAAPAATLIGGGGGVSSLFGGAGVDAITTGSIGGAGAATPAATAGGGIASTLPATVNVVPTPAAIGLQGAKGLGTFANPAGQSYAGAGTATSGPAAAVKTVTPTFTPGVTAGTAATPTFTPGVTAGTVKGKLGGIWNFVKDPKNLPMLALGATALSNTLGGLFAKKEKGEKKRDISKIKYQGGAASFPSDPGTAAYTEHNYFPNYQYANGGIVTLANGGMIDPQMQMPQDMSFPQNGVPGTDEAPMLEDIPSSPYPASQIGTAPEPPVGETAGPSTDNDRELIAQTVEAIQGKIPDPGPILLAFVQEFGEPALQDLAQRVKSMPPSGGPAGPGDGQSDSIPAVIDGHQPAALSEGEYVIPADVVSGLGNGSTQAGASQLDGMVGGVRQQRTGSPQQPPQLNAGGLISGYANGGIVALAGGGPVRTQADKRSEAFWDGYDPGEQTGFAGNYSEWVVPSGTEPRSPRMPMIYRDWAMPMTVDPERGQSQEWVDNIRAYQRAIRDLSMDKQGLPTSYGKNARR